MSLKRSLVENSDLNEKKNESNQNFAMIRLDDGNVYEIKASMLKSKQPGEQVRINIIDPKDENSNYNFNQHRISPQFTQEYCNS